MAWEPKITEDWDADTELQWLVAERTLSPEDTPWEVAKRDLYGYLPASVRSLAHLALYASDEKTRLNAAKLHIETVAKIEEMEHRGKGGPLDELLKGVTAYVNDPPGFPSSS